MQEAFSQKTGKSDEMFEIWISQNYLKNSTSLLYCITDIVYSTTQRREYIEEENERGAGRESEGEISGEEEEKRMRKGDRPRRRREQIPIRAIHGQRFYSQWTQNFIRE